jgi:hypothetical protein
MMKKWVQVIIFLKAEAIENTKPIEFDKFLAIEESKIYDELFDCDDIDYCYEHIKIKRKQKKQLQAFNVDDIELDDESKFFPYKFSKTKMREAWTP